METIRVRAFRRPLRFAAAAAQAVALVNLLELAGRLGADVFFPAEVERLPLPFLVRRVLFGTALPLVVPLVARWLSRGTLELDGERGVLRVEGGEVELAFARRRPWRVPLPEAGFDVDSSVYGLALDGPAPLWRHWALRLGLVPAAITFVLFRLHEHITYGGLTGEWVMFGPRRWLRTLAGVTLYTFCTLFVCDAVLRALVLLVALARPRARAAAEATAAIAWYAGIAAVLALRLLG